MSKIIPSKHNNQAVLESNSSRNTWITTMIQILQILFECQKMSNFWRLYKYICLSQNNNDWSVKMHKIRLFGFALQRLLIWCFTRAVGCNICFYSVLPVYIPVVCSTPFYVWNRWSKRWQRCLSGWTLVMFVWMICILDWKHWIRWVCFELRKVLRAKNRWRSARCTCSTTKCAWL